MKAYKLQVKKVGDTNQGIVTIPKTIWEGKGWKNGTPLNFKFGTKGEVVIEEAKPEA